MRHTRAVLVAATAASALVLSACGGGGGSESEEGASGAGGEGFPITVEHAYGETVIEEKPERVATVAWGNHEAALALGVVPVIMEKATWGDDDGNGVLPWVEDAVEELGAEMPETYDPTDGIDFEAVANAEPDVILAGYSGLTQEEYDTLSQIAPVAAYPDTPWGSTWQDTLAMDAKAMGMEAEGQELITELEGVVEEKAAERENLAGTSAAWFYAEPTDLSSLGFYTSHDPRQAFFEEIGMTTPESIQAKTEETEEFMGSESAETAADTFADVDVAVFYGTSDDTADEILGDPLLGKVPALENGSYAALPGDGPEAAIANPTPLSITTEYFDGYLDALDEAAATAK